MAELGAPPGESPAPYEPHVVGSAPEPLEPLHLAPPTVPDPDAWKEAYRLHKEWRGAGSKVGAVHRVLARAVKHHEEWAAANGGWMARLPGWPYTRFDAPAIESMLGKGAPLPDPAPFEPAHECALIEPKAEPVAAPLYDIFEPLPDCGVIPSLRISKPDVEAAPADPGKPTPKELHTFREFVKKPDPVPEDPGALVARHAAPFEPLPDEPCATEADKVLQDWEKVVFMDAREKAALYKKKKPPPLEPEEFQPFEPPEPFTLLEPEPKPEPKPEPAAAGSKSGVPKPVAAAEPVAQPVAEPAAAVEPIACSRAIKSVHVTHDTVTITFYS